MLKSRGAPKRFFWLASSEFTSVESTKSANSFESQSYHSDTDDMLVRLFSMRVF